MTDHIKDFWYLQAEVHGTSPSASWGDSCAIELEIDTIGKYIKENDRVLDVGCANGYAALRHLEKNPKHIIGVDFSEPMIAQAIKAKQEGGYNNLKIHFESGDVRNLSLESGRFDLVYTTRVLINLSTWEEQKKGINECIRVCRPGGTVVFSEGFWEPLVKLNAMRALVSLPPLVEHDFNRYIKRDRLKDYLKELGVEFHIEDFSSIYYLGSRFLRELVTKHDQYTGYSNPINQSFYELEKIYSGGDFGIQQACVVRK